MVRARSLTTRSRVAAILAFAAGFMALAFGWIYRGGFGEGDSMSIAAGIFQARLRGTGIHEPLLYMFSSHPLYEAALIKVSSGPVDSLIGLMNAASWISSGIALVFFGLGLARIGCGLGVILIAMGALAANGLYFELSTYGHPIMPALACTAAAAWLLAGEGAVAFALGLVLLEFGLAMRLDAALLWPGIAATFWIIHRPRPGMKTLALCCLLAAHLCAIRLLFGETHHADFLRNNYRLGLIAAGSLKSVLDAGPGLVLLAAVAVGSRLWSRPGNVGLPVGNKYKLLYLAAWALPGWIAYVANPTPARHFLYFAYGLAWASAVLMNDFRVRRIGMAAIIAAVAIANLGSHWATGPLARHFAGRMRPEIVTRLSQSIFARHRTNQAYLDWDRARWEYELSAHPGEQIYIGAWRELGGLLLNASRANLVVQRADMKQAAGSSVSQLWIGQQRVRFVEWYPGRPFPDPGSSAPRVIVHPYPPEAAAQLGALRASIPSNGISFEYW